MSGSSIRLHVPGTVLGGTSTVPVTMDEMIVYSRAVSRAVSRAFVVADMPFGSYQVSEETAVTNAIRFVKEARADVVKLEGAGPSLSRIRAIVDAGIPVMGHIGLTPQSATMLGGFKTQGRTAEKAMRLMDEARALARETIALARENVDMTGAANSLVLVARRLGISEELREVVELAPEGPWKDLVRAGARGDLGRVGDLFASFGLPPLEALARLFGGRIEPSTILRESKLLVATSYGRSPATACRPRRSRSSPGRTRR